MKKNSLLFTLPLLMLCAYSDSGWATGTDLGVKRIATSAADLPEPARITKGRRGRLNRAICKAAKGKSGAVLDVYLKRSDINISYSEDKFWSIKCKKKHRMLEDPNLLQYAVYHGNMDMVRDLIQRLDPLDMNVITDGKTVLDWLDDVIANSGKSLAKILTSYRDAIIAPPYHAKSAAALNNS